MRVGRAALRLTARDYGRAPVQYADKVIEDAAGIDSDDVVSTGARIALPDGGEEAASRARTRTVLENLIGKQHNRHSRDCRPCPPDGPLTEVLRTRDDYAELASPCTFSLMSAETLSHG
jgi:hypothetical protein